MTSVYIELLVGVVLVKSMVVVKQILEKCKYCEAKLSWFEIFVTRAYQCSAVFKQIYPPWLFFSHNIAEIYVILYAPILVKLSILILFEIYNYSKFWLFPFYFLLSSYLPSQVNMPMQCKNTDLLPHLTRWSTPSIIEMFISNKTERAHR